MRTVTGGFGIMALALGGLALGACGGNQRATLTSAGADQAARQERLAQMEVGLEPPLPATLASVEERNIDQIAFEYSWNLDLPGPAHTTWIDPDIPDLLFVQLVNGEVHGIDGKSGNTRFVTVPLPALIELPADAVRTEILGTDRDQQAGRKLRYDERFYLIAQSTLFCIDAVYGQIIWRYELPFEPSTGPTASGLGEGLRVFIGDWAGRLRVISYNQEYERPFVLWQHRLNGIPQAPCLVSEGLAYAATTEGLLTCFDFDRDLKWHVPTHGALMGQPALRGRSLYMGAQDNVLHVINRLSGTKLGQLYLDAPIHRSPFLFQNVPDTVYVWTEGPAGGLHALQAVADAVEFVDVPEPRFPLEVERLARKWFIPGLDRLVGASPRQIYCMSGDNSDVFAIDKKTGSVDWRWNLGQALGALPMHVVEHVDHKDILRSIITIGANGQMVAYRIFGQYTR